MNDKKLVVYCCENSALLCAETLKAENGNKDLFRDVRIVPLPCSGKIEMGIILKTLEEGARGVLVLGCPRDNCKFFRGSTRAGKRVDMVGKILSDAGIEPRRVRMDYLSSVDTQKFETIVSETLDGLRSST